MGTKENIFPCGAVGSGTAFKIINNYLSAIASLAVNCSGLLIALVILFPAYSRIIAENCTFSMILPAIL